MESKKDHFNVIKKVMQKYPDWDKDEIVNEIVDGYAFKFGVELIIWFRDNHIDLTKVDMDLNNPDNVFSIVEKFQKNLQLMNLLQKRKNI